MSTAALNGGLTALGVLLIASIAASNGLIAAPSKVDKVDKGDKGDKGDKDAPNKADKTCPPPCVVVEISGFSSDQGQALVALFTSREGFPNNVKKAAQSRSAKIVNKKVTVTFGSLDKGDFKGDFAIAVHHDENGDFKMNTNWLGAPTEAYGASRDARRRFGPPRYRDAKLTVGEGETKTIRIKVK